MGLRKKKVEVYEVSYECDKCKAGIMKVVTLEGGYRIYSGHKIKHKCTTCGHSMYLHRRHPFRVFK